MPSPQGWNSRFQAVLTRQVGELLINSGNRLLQHPAMLWCRGTAEVGGGPRPVQLERGTLLSQDTLLRCEGRLHHTVTRGFFLLRLD